MKMKGLFLAGLLWMTATGMQARGIEHFMDELASQQEVTRVSLGAAAMALGSMFTDTYGVKHIDVLCLEHCSDEVGQSLVRLLPTCMIPTLNRLFRIRKMESGPRYW